MHAYLHHLWKSKEILGMQLLIIHNIAIMNRLMREIRAAIPQGRLADVRRKWLV